ncbi:MAG: RNA methyltransferase [Oligoflexales bacterium]|nr:RNA methyltransferase [Oligoflexales bacterium]
MDLPKNVKKISSTQNPRIKSLILLQKRKNREEQGKFGMEGVREIKRAIACGYELLEVYLCPKLFSDEATSTLPMLLSQKASACFEIDEKCFNKVAIRKQTDGVYTVFASKTLKLEDCIPPKKNPLILVLEGIEKPGNLGALLRSADGAGASGVVTLDDCCDPFNPQVIRSSLGTIFSTPLVQTSLENLREFLKINQIDSFAAALSTKSISYTQLGYHGPSAFFLGSEAQGLSQESIKACKHQIMIPMLGIADSLNVSVAGATLLYEALRQRTCSSPQK